MRLSCAILSGVTFVSMLVALPVLTWFYDSDEIAIGFGIFMVVAAAWLYLLARGLDARAFSEGVTRRRFARILIALGMRLTYLAGALILTVVSLGFMLSLASFIYMAIGSALSGVGGRMVLLMSLGVLYAVLMAAAAGLSSVLFFRFAWNGRITRQSSVS
jgi:hypothetical protein